MSGINGITDIMTTNSMNRMSIITPMFSTYKYYSLHISQNNTIGKYG